MNSNNKSITQSLGISARFCTPYDGSWLASKEEIQKTIALKDKHRKMVQVKLAEMRRIDSPAIHPPMQTSLFATEEELQKARLETTKNREQIEIKLAEIQRICSPAIHQDLYPAKGYTSKKADKRPESHPDRTPC